MMKSIAWCITKHFVFIAVLSASLAGLSFADKPSPPPPPPPPPVRYEIQFFNSPTGNGGYMNDFNNQSQAVGWYSLGGRKRAWFYDPGINPTGVTDLDQLVAIERPDGQPGGVPSGWYIASAVGMNEFGAIVGYLELSNDPAVNPTIRQGYVLDLKAIGGPKLTIIPDQSLGFAYPKDINNRGLVLGTYALTTAPNGVHDNYLYQTDLYGGQVADAAVRPVGLVVQNTEKVRLSEQTWSESASVWSAAQFAGDWQGHTSAFRYSETSGVTNFPQLIGTPKVWDTTTLGDFCGAAYYDPPRGKTVRVPVRVMGPNVQMITSQPGRYATKVNSRGDLVLDNNSLYWDVLGAFSLDTLVTGSPQELATWSSRTSLEVISINAPSNAIFGNLIARISFADGSRSFLLLTAVP